ncbi:YlxR family protein [Litorilinea aerophila]|uniref:YlxR family protein n=1 Tax=Litorilinea aerophila TaxID=1204385 RepID=A0A540VBM1_9CHLR|nr:YlxR family protein [Litorilinea aerophila]MCC9078062.1 YlxR family protein [Litorilinea aerophila]GIV76015.1 MAG: hypothetical protein KatS3mg050_0409 [Litorilinea sp.]
MGLKTVRKTQGNRPKHVPQRTCIACRQVAGKRALVRLVRTEQGVEVDPTGKRSGRGAYLHPYQECWQAALRSNRLEQALRTRISEANRQQLAAYMATLPLNAAADQAADEHHEVKSTAETHVSHPRP